ncbi:NACHT domain-containing protein [Actinocrispum wychmicini]|uniref:NACHT domain-containing protein n=1 Tax=Actinocrispum wychmicini TaxID=1213861 RepID=A0A4R2IUU5_9PSEU|nr:helix-turn-helix domain-containing protein [Actinocrispum wychmicini]TCO46735.1 NACHT domain-containing protein [Actinocrispum wychmicini]
MTSLFGARLRELRLQAGLTQEGLANRSFVSVRSIRGFETGERADPRVATVRQLADALALKPDKRQELLDAAAGLTRPEPAVPEPVARPNDSLAEAAEDLAHAVRARWQREEELRQIQDPFPLPVRWESAAEQDMDHWDNICGVPPGATARPLDLGGRLAEIVPVHRRIPSGRLVVLGRAGSGKTILALRFVLDLLGTRARVETVPVIFGIGSWNPTSTALRDWMTDRLIRDHGLAAPGTAAALVESGRILPVLDGFDEIATGLHRAALEQLSATTMPFVLTSRPDEYRRAVAETDVLTAAACVQLADLTLADLAGYLPRTTRKLATPVWDSVLTELRDRPDSPLTSVFRTPLMVALARAIYSDTSDRDPGELLNTERFSTPESLEQHLLGEFIPTVYRTGPGSPDYDVDRVRRWLGHLGSRDIAWWELGTTMPRRSRVLLVGLVVGLVNAVVHGLGAGLREGLAAGLDAALIGGLATGVSFGLVHWLGLVLGGAAFSPSRVRVRLRRGPTPGRPVRRLMLGVAGGLAGGLILGLTGGLGAEVLGGLGTGLLGGLGAGLAFGLVCGLVGALMVRFEAPIDVTSTASPADLLAVNRTTVAYQSLIWGPVFGLCVGLVGGAVDGLAFGLVVGLGVGTGFGLSMTAWGQWLVLARIWLPLTGRLPWAVIAFLDDACRRGVLRQAGAVYQFRHARLQDHLTHP